MPKPVFQMSGFEGRGPADDYAQTLTLVPRLEARIIDMETGDVVNSPYL